MKNVINYFDGITGFAWVLILGFIATVIFSTWLVVGLWNQEGFNIFFCVLIWITLTVAGFIVAFTLAYIFYKIFE